MRKTERVGGSKKRRLADNAERKRTTRLSHYQMSRTHHGSRSEIGWLAARILSPAQESEKRKRRITKHAVERKPFYGKEILRKKLKDSWMISYCSFCKKNVQVKELGVWYQSESGMWLRQRGSWCNKCGMIISPSNKATPALKRARQNPTRYKKWTQKKVIPRPRS